MIDVPSPSKGTGRRRPNLPEPPKAIEAPSHLDTPTDEGYKTFVNLNFKVTPFYHKRFRLEATLRGLSLKALFEACLQSYLRENGGTLEKPRADLL